MEDSFPQTNLPFEVWSQILALLHPRDQKAIGRVSVALRQIASYKLWAEPEFRTRVDADNLETIAKLSVPIKILKLSQLNLYMNTDKSVAQLVAILSKFYLNAFHIDYKRHMEAKQLGLLLQLPVPSLRTSFLSSEVPVEEYIDTLTGCKKCPDLVIEQDFHLGMTISMWKRVVNLPIVQINASFDAVNKLDLCKYDEVVSRIENTEYILSESQYKHGITPTDLCKFKKVRISKLHMKCLECTSTAVIAYGRVISAFDVESVVESLKKNAQNPTLIIDNQSAAIQDSKLELLFSNFKVEELNVASVAYLESNFDKLVDFISVKHTRDPIKRIVVSGHFMSNCYTPKHLAALDLFGCSEYYP